LILPLAFVATAACDSNVGPGEVAGIQESPLVEAQNGPSADTAPPVASAPDRLRNKVQVNFVPVYAGSELPYTDYGGYGAIEFFARDDFGNYYYPDENGAYTFEFKGNYYVGGQSVYNFCYTDSTKVYADEHSVSQTVRLFVSCE
jgi:hypothetical protein